MADGYLSGLVATVNQGAPGARVLLCVGGLVVTGTLMPRDAYRQEFAAAGGAEAIAHMEQAIAAYEVATADVTQFPEQDVLKAQPRYIFLRNATVAGHPDVLPLWQAELEAVDGWALLSVGGEGSA